VLGPSEGGLGGQDGSDGFPASGHNAYPSGENPFLLMWARPLLHNNIGFTPSDLYPSGYKAEW